MAAFAEAFSLGSIFSLAFCPYFAFTASLATVCILPNFEQHRRGCDDGFVNKCKIDLNTRNEAVAFVTLSIAFPLFARASFINFSLICFLSVACFPRNLERQVDIGQKRQGRIQRDKHGSRGVTFLMVSRAAVFSSGSSSFCASGPYFALISCRSAACSSRNFEQHMGVDRKW